MMKRTHLLVGITATIPFINWSNAFIAPVAILGALFPDWDHIIGSKQRNIAHSAAALIMTSVPFAVLDLQLGLLWALNYSTHLILDSFTIMGVPLLYPFSNKYYGLKLLKTRGTEDMLIVLMFLYIIINII
jgi:inner membrane protein